MIRGDLHRSHTRPRDRARGRPGLVERPANNHHTRHTAFAEDTRPWITGEPRGTLAVALLRRIGYSPRTLFRSVMQRSEERRLVRWAVLLSWVLDMLVGEAEVARLRRRGLAVALG